MSSGKDHSDELDDLIEEVGQSLTERSWEDFNWFLSEELGFSEEYDPIPLEFCMGIAHGLADASGFRVVLQATILEPVEGDPDMLRKAGQREVGAANPNLFTRVIERGEDAGPPHEAQ